MSVQLARQQPPSQQPQSQQLQQPQPPGTEPIPAKSTLVKTDKPRPHVCPICTRSFARLEHLKRHERSHTKEKPFKCPVCERCFARRDLLLRHKQKLHASFPESGSSPSKKAGSRRKSSVSQTTSGTTSADEQRRLSSTPSVISETGASTLSYSEMLRTQLAPSEISIRPRPASFSATSATSYASFKEIDAINSASPFSQQSAPTHVDFATPQLGPAVYGDSSNNDIPLEEFFKSSDSLFINPQQLLGHDNDSNNHQHQQQHNNRFQQFQEHQQQHQFNNGHHARVDYLSNNHQHSSHHGTRHLSISVDPHSHYFPKVEEELSPGNVLGLDTSEDLSWMPPNTNDFRTLDPQNLLNGSSFSPPPYTTTRDGSVHTSDSPLSLSVTASHLTGMSNPTMSPPQASTGSEGGDNTLSNAPTVSTTMSPPPLMTGDDTFSLHFALTSDSKDLNKPFATHHEHIAADDTFWNSITPHVEQTTDRVVAQKGGQIITPQLRLHILTTLSTPTPFSSSQLPQLPSTSELQRYINCYTSNFGKHLPFLHHSMEFTPENVPLALGMAATGALYAFEESMSINVFEISRSCIHVYLESRRERKDIDGTESQITPLWLVQALVLGVIYGLFNGEPLANEIAVAQANAVVSLAKSAGLHLPPRTFLATPRPDSPLDEKWRYFVNVQERIRTMHVVHIISCLLATSYNVVSTLKNDDIRCGSPCDESLWSCSTAAEWWEVMRKKDLDTDFPESIEGVSYCDCLAQLKSGNTLMEKIPQFTLLSLMYGIHLEIHECKLSNDQVNRNSFHVNGSTLAGDSVAGRELVWLEMEKVGIESMLRAWETTWSLSPLASLSPNSQYGPLMSDSIPLSSLAHVRVYVDLRKVKEYFWKRDFLSMGRELDNLIVLPYFETHSGIQKQFDGLLEAASYAADAISLWEKHSVKWTLEVTASQTFIHTLVSLFDCGLVVSEFLYRLERKNQSEWREEESLLVTRVGKIFYRVLDVVGHDNLDVASFEGEADDESRVAGVLDIDKSMSVQNDNFARNNGRLSILALQVVAKILCKAYVWPFALVMGSALQARCQQIKVR
jgi:hypothetical protein